MDAKTGSMKRVISQTAAANHSGCVKTARSSQPTYPNTDKHDTFNDVTHGSFTIQTTPSLCTTLTTKAEDTQISIGTVNFPYLQTDSMWIPMCKV